MSPQENVEPVVLQPVHHHGQDDHDDHDNQCSRAVDQIIDLADELDFKILLGADEYLTTVDRTIVSMNSSNPCQSCGLHLMEFEIMFDPLAGVGQFMGYVDGERVIWRDISWADFV